MTDPMTRMLRHRSLKALLLALTIGAVSSASAGAAPVTTNFAGTVSSTGTAAQTFSINVSDISVPIHASLDWTTTTANLNLYLTAPGSTVPVKQATSPTARPEVVDWQPTVAGTYKLRVKAATGTSAFSLSATYGQVTGDAGIVTYSKTYGFEDTRSIFPYGMAYDPTDNTVIVGDYWNFRIQRFSAAGAKIATYKNSVQGGVGAPYDIAIDPWDTPASGLANFWVADQEQQAVVEFDHNGNILHTLGVGGTGTYLHGHGCGGGNMDNPTHLVIDPANGNIYISNTACNNVYEFAHDGTFIRQFDWSGWKTATGFFTPTPRGIGMDENGNIYVLELNSRTIAVFNQQGQFLRVFPQITDMNDPRGLDIDTNHHRIYAVGALHGRVYEFDYQGNILKKWDSPLGTNAVHSNPSFNSIRSPAVDPTTGNVFIGDTWGYRTYKFGVDGPGTTATPLAWSSPPSPPANGGYTQQTGVALSPDGKLFVTGSFDQRVQAFDTGSYCNSETDCPGFLYQWGTRVNPAPNATGFDYPKAMVFADGKLWIGENDGNDIQVYDPSGTWIHRFGTQGPAVGQFRQGIQGLYVDEVQHLVFATDVGNCRLQVFDENFVLNNTSGAPLKYMGGCGTTAVKMSAPRGVVADGSTAYVIETGGSKISVWNWTTQTEIATYKPSCGNGGTMSGPWDAAWDPTHSWIYIGDKGKARVVRWSPTTHACEVVTTGADTPEGALSGPDFLNFGPDGKLYVSDNNKRVYSFTFPP
ncbi:MAG: tripartite motif-containing protein 71 [Gaiellales bacterium]|nr:tripartite motif-containing protein 71 [Gaiellales bacterium]